MPDTPALLVPIRVDALLVNPVVVSTVPFERWANSWENLDAFTDPVPPPGVGTSAPGLGVHLHWQLPKALTHGVAPKSSTQPVFPLTPNRWLVARLSSASNATGAQAIAAWIVESDFSDLQTGSTAYVSPASTASNIELTRIGRNLPVSRWAGEVSSNGTLFLTATGVADASFLGYQPGLVDVFSFFDASANSLAENASVTYLVSGWYSNPASDPLVLQPAFDPKQALFTDLAWQALGIAEGQAAPNRSVYHGLVNSLVWQTSTLPARVDSSASSMQVGLGYTGVDALSAILAEASQGGSLTPEQMEMRLAAFQYDSLHLLDQPDASAQLELRIRDAWFGSTPGGTLWQIVPVGQNQTSPDPLSPVAQPSPAPLTGAQSEWLAALNTAQRQFDIDQRELIALQRELFCLWWKARYLATQQELMQNSTVDNRKLALELFEQIDSSQGTSGTNFFSKVAAQQELVNGERAKLPDPSATDGNAAFSKGIPGNQGQWALRASAMPSFQQPADPVVVVAGITPPVAAPDTSKPLPCRLATAATTGIAVSISGKATPVTASTGSMASVLPNPGTMQATGGKPLSALLDPSIAEALSALATEAYFADPNNAASILLNGLGQSDAALVAALKASIADATAQTASIPNPLQAAFAFTVWRQAWTPLFVEWYLQFYPTVQTSPAGQSLPLAGWLAPAATPVQDNLPMDLANWTFDGSDDVAGRGYEYYSWNGGDVWAQNSWLVPQQFVGRGILTPNAENLFLSRLTEYIGDQPVASASAVVTDGAVTAVVLQSGGSGYSAPPAIAFSSGGGSGAEATAQLVGGIVTAITITNGGSGYTATPRVAIGPSDWTAIESLIDAIGKTRFLSQTLSGFNDNFLMRRGMHTVPPDAVTAAVIDGQDRGVPVPSLGDVKIQFGQGQPFFFPVRGGFFCFKQLQIVDGFGQVLDLLTANGNGDGSSSSFQPILGPGLLPNAAQTGFTSQCQVEQAPRVVQPSRLNLTWLDASDDAREVFLSADANPVAGWLIPNHLDHAIAVYNADGIPLGELLVLMQTDTTKAVTWLAAPGSPAAVDDPADIPNLHLRSMIAAFTDANGGIPEANRVDAFNAWFNSIDETLWTIDPPGGQHDQDLAVLMGRPLAVARAKAQFELYGRPAYNLSWRDTFDLADPSNAQSIQAGEQEAGFTSLSFPIRLGSTELLDDGLVGYFLADAYTAFNAVHAAASPASTYIQPVGGTNYLSLPFDYPSYTSQILTLLVDPRCAIHAATGILPDAELQLPAQFYADALRTLAVSFRSGPLLADPTNLRMPLPALTAGSWSWISQPTPNTFVSSSVIVADAKARLADSPPHLVEGWLLLTPPKTPSS